MHEWGDSGISAVLLAIAVVVLLTLVVAHQGRVRAARNQEIRRLQFETAAEARREEAQAREEYKSMLANQHICAVCSNLSSTRCSRCKAVRYCSAKCQRQHWLEGHKQECRPPVSGTRLVRSSNGMRKLSDALSSSVGPENGSKGYLGDDSNANQSADPAQASRSKTVPSSQSNGSVVKPDKVLFPYDLFAKYFNWDRLNVSPCGLINCGNSCFANVVLQCLTYTRPLTAYLLGGTHKRECKKSEWCFLCELQDHVLRALHHNSRPFQPLEILQQIHNIGRSLGVGRQEDAHEFMRFAVDSMQSICLSEAGGPKGMGSRTVETTLIHHIFGGHLESQVTCMGCRHESSRCESMMDLAVEIQGGVETLEDALTQFTATEWLDGENKYKCDRCNAYVEAKKQLTIHVAPNILTIALKRFQSGNFGKLNKRVTFGEELDISPFMSRKGDRPPIYRLYGVVVHVDMLNASFFGHYICYLKDSEGNWYKIDDSKVENVDLEKVKAQKAYMLLYSRATVRPPTLTDEATIFERADEPNGEPVRSAEDMESRGTLEALPQHLRNGIVAADGEHGLHAMLNVRQIESNGGNGKVRGNWETEASSSTSTDIEEVSMESSEAVASDSCLTGSSRQHFPYANDHGVVIQTSGLESEAPSSETAERFNNDQESELPNDFSEVSLQVSNVEAPSTPKQFKRTLDDCLSFSPPQGELSDSHHFSAWHGGERHGRSLLSSVAPSTPVSSRCESEALFCEEEDSVAQAKRQHVENEEPEIHMLNDMSCLTETEEELKWEDVFWDENEQQDSRSPESSTSHPIREYDIHEDVQEAESQEGPCVANGSRDDVENEDNEDKDEGDDKQNFANENAADDIEDTLVLPQIDEEVPDANASQKNVSDGNELHDESKPNSCSSSDSAGQSPELSATAAEGLESIPDSSSMPKVAATASLVKSKPLFKRGFLDHA